MSQLTRMNGWEERYKGLTADRPRGGPVSIARPVHRLVVLAAAFVVGLAGLTAGAALEVTGPLVVKLWASSSAVPARTLRAGAARSRAPVSDRSSTVRKSQKSALVSRWRTRPSPETAASWPRPATCAS